MSDRGLTIEAVLTGLQDIRLPAEALGGVLAEILAALGLGLFCALCLGAVLRLFSVALKPAPPPPTLADRLQAAAALPEDQRRLELLHMLKAVRPEAFMEFAGDLYREGHAPGIEALEAELIRHG